MSWTKSQGIWSIDFKVKGNRFSLVISPRIDMSDVTDAPLDLEKLHEHQLFLSRGPNFDERDDVFLGYYPDRIMAANTGLHVLYYMKGKVVRARPKITFLLFGILAALFTLMAWPSVIKKVEITTVTQEAPKTLPPPVPVPAKKSK